MEYIEIQESEAKDIYCKVLQIYTSDNGTDFNKVPCSGDYGSHAPAETLFYRSVHKTENTRYFIKECNLALWMEGNMPTYGGYKCSNCGHQVTEIKLEHCPKCNRTMYTRHVGYKKIPAWTWKNN